MRAEAYYSLKDIIVVNASQRHREVRVHKESSLQVCTGKRLPQTPLRLTQRFPLHPGPFLVFNASIVYGPRE